jgi:DNA-binding SARP family transcriptional activator
MLTAGGPYQPHDRAEVVIDAAVLATLIGSDAVQLAEWPRLHIADDLDAALLHVETEIVRRGRILSFHDAPTVADLRHRVPDEEALPPVLFVGETPTTAALNRRMQVTAGLGARLNVTILLLGEWAGGPTLHVAADGHTRAVGDPAGEQPLPDRMGVLEPQTAAQLLLTVREAHTGQPPTTPQPPIPLGLPTPGEPTAAAMTAEADAATPTAPNPPKPRPADRDTAAPLKARLRVLGTPNINDLTPPQQGLRGKALELAVFLACHPDGASTRDIGEHIAGDYKIHQADAQVHQNLSNLRKIFALIAGQRDNGFILTLPGATTRYRLNPDNVDVDLWALRDLLRAAHLATGERRRDLLATACDLYTAPLADGCRYDWITPHRETVRRWGTEAHQLYAETLLDTDPQAAADILDKAIRLDKHNEQLYVRALHTRHALRDSDGLRIVMRALSKAMAEVDAEPSEKTTAIYHRLANGLDQR